MKLKFKVGAVQPRREIVNGPVIAEDITLRLVPGITVEGLPEIGFGTVQLRVSDPARCGQFSLGALFDLELSLSPAASTSSAAPSPASTPSASASPSTETAAPINPA